MDPVATETLMRAIKAVIPVVQEGAKQTLGKLLGPAIDEAGLLLQDGVRSIRFRNQVKTLLATQEMLDDAGIEPQSIPLKLLVPLLEGASLEDDDRLSDMWSSLLANGADSENGQRVRVEFSEIMKQLNLSDALILNKFFLRNYEEEPHQVEVRFDPIEQRLLESKLIDETHLDLNVIQLSLENLVRLSLIERWRDDDTAQQFTNYVREQAMEARRINVSTRPSGQFLTSVSKPSSSVYLRVTILGYEFFKACQPPCERR